MGLRVLDKQNISITKAEEWHGLVSSTIETSQKGPTKLALRDELGADAVQGTERRRDLPWPARSQGRGWRGA